MPWWAMILWVAYLIYFLVRTYAIGYNVSHHGLVQGYKYSFLDIGGNDLYLGHIIWMVIDIPPTVVGSILPFIRGALTLKVHTFKKKENKPGA